MACDRSTSRKRAVCGDRSAFCGETGPPNAHSRWPRQGPGRRAPTPEPPGLHGSLLGLRPFPAWTAVLYPFGELRVHHEVVDVLLCFGELQLPGHHGHHEGSAASTLWADSKRAGGERTSSRGQVWGSPAVGARALWLVRGTEPVGTLIPAPTRGSVALLARLQS